MFTLLLLLISFLASWDAPEPAAAVQPVVQRNVVYAQRDWTLDRRTSLDVYIPGDDAKERAIVVYVHGGGWSIGDKHRVHQKPKWANGNGWILVSVNYRLSPRVRHPEHARDVSAAIAHVRTHAREWGGDPEQIVLMGHSAGAHLAAIVASEETLLAEHGLAPTDLRGVVLLDGAGYDLPTQMASPLLRGQVRRMYNAAFSDDPELWVRASPTLQAEPGDELPPLLAVHVGNRVRSHVESEALVKAWAKTGAESIRHHAPGKDHRGINVKLGAENDPDTEVIQRFLQSVFEAE